MRLIIFTFLLFTFASLNGIKASPALQKPLSTILAHPQSAALINRVERQGPIKVTYVSFGEQKPHAIWEADTRTIFVNKDIRPTHQQVINSIIFELHNASSNKELMFLFDQAEKGALAKDQFVEGVERMEHRNALAAQALIEDGIAKGYFPVGCRMYFYDSFDDYYIVQQILGHSQWIAAKYDEFSPYQNTPYHGTLKSLPLKSNKEKDFLLDLISYKNDPDTNYSKRLDWIKKRYASANSDGIKLINYVFREDIDQNPLHFGSAWAI